jgi:hypothetical protein
MEMFQDGGLKDEGGMIDEVSGNDVPSGSTREEVRDDIPAQLSEGEFVFPADVVRFLGLEKLMTDDDRKLRWVYRRWNLWVRWVTQMKPLCLTICPLI